MSKKSVDHATFDEKVRMAYEEMDPRRTRAVNQEAFVSLLNKLSIGFSVATMQDLFLKADTDKDGVLTLREFQKFADNYPTLLDVLYYRSKDYWLDVQQQKNIEAAQQQLTDLHERETAASRTAAEAQLAADGQEHAVQLVLRDIEDAEAREREARGAMERAHQDTDACRQDMRMRANELSAARDKGRQKQQELADTRKESEHQALRIQAADGEVAKAEERLRDIERMMQEQRRVLDECMASSARARDDLAAAQIKEDAARAAVDDAARDMEAADEERQQAEHALHEQQQREAEVGQMLRDACGETGRALQRRDEEQRRLQAMRDDEAKARKDHEGTQRAVDDLQQQLDEIIAENQEHNDRRQTIQQEEAPLLEQEVRLKEQRECLEAKEGELRNRFNEFSQTRTSVPPASPTNHRGPSPTASSPYRSTGNRSPQSAYSPSRVPSPSYSHRY